MTPDQIYNTLLLAKQAYYDGKPFMSDDEFDDLEEKLRGIDPTHEYFKIVGITNSRQKIQHAIPMLSAAKSKTVDDVMKWIGKIGCQGEVFQVEPKVDGLSATLKYKNRMLSYVATRGDGMLGQCIDHIRPYVKLPPSIGCDGEVEIRGELYIPKGSCPNPENKPLRNMAVGFVNRKDDGLEDLKYVNFVAYQVVGEKNFKTEKDKLCWLDDSGFHVVDHSLNFSSREQLDEIYQRYLNDLRRTWQYETDGLILVVNDISRHEEIDSRWTVDHHHHFNMALKGKANEKETILRDIEWNVSRQGKLIPVARFDTVNLDDANISRASLSNYETVINMKLEKGDKIMVARANSVIPYVVSNVTKNVRQREPS